MSTLHGVQVAPVTTGFLKYLGILAAILSLVNATLIPELELADDSIAQVLELFPNCHVKLIYGKYELVTGRIHLLVLLVMSFHLTIVHLSRIQLQEVNHRGYTISTRFANCFVFGVIEDELTSNGNDYERLRDLLEFDIPTPETLHHILFIGMFEEYKAKNLERRWRFYRYKLRQTKAKGMIFSINHDEKFTYFDTQVVCIICWETLLDLNVSMIVSGQLENQLQLTTTNSMFVQRQVELGDYHAKTLVVNANCDFANPRFRPGFAYNEPLLCMYPALLSVYNISLNSVESGIGKSKMSLVSLAYSTQRTRGMGSGMDALIPSLFLMFPLRYTMFEPLPTFTAADLVKPYDWKSWLMALIALSLLSSIISIQVFPTIGGFFEAAFYLARISLNQPDGMRIQPKIRSHILLIWLLAMLVLSEAYKGMILSFLATPSGVTWPKDLGDLISQTSYNFLRFENVIVRAAFSGRRGTKVAALLKDKFDRDKSANEASQNFVSDYNLLKHVSVYETTQDFTSAAADFIYANKYKASKQIEGPYKVGNERSSKFAYLHLERTEGFIPIVRTLFPSLAASIMKDIKGFSSFYAWVTPAGFLQRWYSNSMSRLVATGFAQATLNYWRIWNPCIYLGEVLTKLNTDYNVSSIDIYSMPEFSKCIRVALSRKTTNIAESYLKESPSERPLSIEQVIATFLVTMVCLSVAFSCFVSEWIISRVQIIKDFVKIEYPDCLKHHFRNRCNANIIQNAKTCLQGCNALCKFKFRLAAS